MKKNQSIKIVFAIAITVNLVACSRLDDNLFNPNTEKITAYTFDKYTGDVDFRLDASYKIPDSLIHLITLASKMEDEGSPNKNLWRLYWQYKHNCHRYSYNVLSWQQRPHGFLLAESSLTGKYRW
jgi:hypothetical protein